MGREKEEEKERKRKERERERNENERTRDKEKNRVRVTQNNLINLARPFQAGGAFFGAPTLGLDHWPIRMHGVRHSSNAPGLSRWGQQGCRAGSAY